MTAPKAANLPSPAHLRQGRFPARLQIQQVPQRVHIKSVHLPWRLHCWLQPLLGASELVEKIPQKMSYQLCTGRKNLPGQSRRPPTKANTRQI